MDTVSYLTINGETREIADNTTRTDVDTLQTDVADLKLTKAEVETARSSNTDNYTYNSLDARLEAIETEINAVEAGSVGGTGVNATEITGARVTRSSAGQFTADTLKDRIDADYDKLSGDIDDLETKLSGNIDELINNIDNRIGRTISITSNNNRYTYNYNVTPGEIITVEYVSTTSLSTSNLGVALRKDGANPIVMYPDGYQYQEVNTKRKFIVPISAIGYNQIYLIYNGESESFFTVNLTLGRNNIQRNNYYHNITLQSGYVTTQGVLIANNNRKTTGYLPYTGPVLISINKGYSLNYMMGTSNIDFTDKGYLINDGGTILLNENTEIYNCFVLTIVKLNDIFTDEDDIGFIITPINSNDASLIKKTDIINNEIPIINNKLDNLKSISYILYKGIATGSNWETYTRAACCTTKQIPYTSKLKLYWNSNYNLAYNIGENTTEGFDRGYVKTNPAEIGENPSVYKYISFNFIAADNHTLTDQDLIDLDLKIIHLDDNENIQDINLNYKKLIERKKIELFTNSITLSDINNTLAASDGFDINNKGLICAGAVMAKNAIGEWYSPSWNGYLVTANIADIEQTKQTVKVFSLWDSSFSGFNNWSINFVQHGIAKFTGEDEISVLAEVGLQYDEETKVVYAVRKFTPSTNTLASDVTICDLTVFDTTYNMIYGGNLNSAQSDIEEIWTNTGIEHPVGYAGVNQYNYTIGQNPKKYNGYFYVPIGIGNHSHALCKSQDLIHWEFVCDIPLSQASEEVAIAFYNNYIYVTSRGNYTVDQQYSKVMKSAVTISNLSSDPAERLNNWNTPVILTGCKLERPTIACLNNRIYIMQGTGTGAKTENKTIARSNKVFFVLDLNLNIIKRTELSFTYPLLHPQFLTFGGNLWMLVSSDKRCFAFTGNPQGDGRSELSFAHLDEEILLM